MLDKHGIGGVQVSFWQYTWSSSVGVLPGMAFFIYLGSLAHNLMDLRSNQPRLNSTTAIVGIAVSGQCSYTAQTSLISHLLMNDDGTRANLRCQPCIASKFLVICLP